MVINRPPRPVRRIREMASWRHGNTPLVWAATLALANGEGHVAKAPARPGKVAHHQHGLRLWRGQGRDHLVHAAPDHRFDNLSAGQVADLETEIAVTA